MVLKLEKTHRIDAPVEPVYRYVAWPANLPAVWPCLVAVSDVQWRRDGRCCFRWVYQLAGLGRLQRND
jgi:uncharacterized protein YndB with AHSA1/START domain